MSEKLQAGQEYPNTKIGYAYESSGNAVIVNSKCYAFLHCPREETKENKNGCNDHQTDDRARDNQILCLI